PEVGLNSTAKLVSNPYGTSVASGALATNLLPAAVTLSMSRVLLRSLLQFSMVTTARAVEPTGTSPKLMESGSTRMHTSGSTTMVPLLVLFVLLVLLVFWLFVFVLLLEFG